MLVSAGPSPIPARCPVDNDKCAFVYKYTSPDWTLAGTPSAMCPNQGLEQNLIQTSKWNTA
ncbi:hypothetical protein G9P44_004327 [Scheffersomyces stipitis]|nr:hypothetical protein G9P44_004327 [Scheffersomyces stipitis]